MPVALFTGLPGAGKTAQLVAEIVRLREAEPGRPIFAMGINGLKEGLAAELTMEQLHAWWELPPGSIICLDECQEEHLMPKDRGNPALWVQRIAKVRHHGMDFLLTTQHPQNMSAYVRRLVDKHVHTVRKFKSTVVSRYTWGRCMDDPEKGSVQKSAVESVGTLPKQVFELYKSSSLHTMKRSIPRKVYIFAVLVVVAIAAAVSVPVLIRKAQVQNTDSIKQVGRMSNDGAHEPELGERARHAAELRTESYTQWIKPRVDGVPWSAPAFDGMAVRAQPRLYCIASEDGRCLCNTEQGTRYQVEVNMCRAIVREGGMYNPFQEPPGSRSDREGQRPPSTAASPPSADAVAMTGGVSGTWKAGIGQAAYIPPQQTVVSALSGDR
ncbi:hypothetical protein FHW69_002819 [Luteibacter sp. Sphag1AF]|uniref:zonular occludens toxin domain-containing protein n=1 Tax=Luteibacter sp. Sphag1AF TaxID=2587031 RepID=UPI0016201ACA|nr:zonular occludens toxin domain-containing protein [Luteibacter sp. Sphag1AF]MBB3228184.1 hypothetical protein [Luteibacter sp. Sphag1AF]